MKTVDLTLGGITYRQSVSDPREEMQVVRATHAVLTDLGFEAWVSVPISLAVDLVDPIVQSQVKSARRLREMTA